MTPLMTPLILTAKELTADELRDLRRAVHHGEAVDGVTVYLPDFEEDPGLPFRLYVVARDLGDATAHVVIQAAPAPRLAPTLDELARLAEAVAGTGMTLFEPTADLDGAALLADELSETTGRHFCIYADAGRPGMREHLADGTSEVVAEFPTWAELGAYLRGRVDGAQP